MGMVYIIIDLYIIFYCIVYLLFGSNGFEYGI